MRVTELAKTIGISSQILRRELSSTDFGVKATDREIPDMLAIGITRVLSVKYKEEIKAYRKAQAKLQKLKPIVLNPTELKETSLTENKEEIITSNDDNEQDLENKDSEIQDIEPKPNKKVLPDNVRKNKKIVQTINSIRFLKPAAKKDVTKKYDKSNKFKNIKSGNSLQKSKVIPTKTKQISSIESLALQKKPKSQIGHSSGDKNKKRVKITHKLTLDDVKDTTDISRVEEERVAEEMERALLKEQKKIKAKGSILTKKEEKNKQQQIQIKKKTGVIELPKVITVKEFSEKVGVQVPKVIAELMKNGVLANINQIIDFDTAALLASEFKIEVKKSIQDLSSEDMMIGDLEKLLQDEPENLITRPPIVTVMGHVDHGKTKLLDTIRNANVISGESGGITQHIGAYQIEYKKNKITFLDTPGHEAFTAIRARGAKVTDIAILVVAADEGIKPQTIEAINHARDAKVPIIVAINKIDKENANIDKVKGELSEQELIPEDWGGETIMVPISALENKNIDQLLDMVLLVAEMEDLKGNPNRPAVGTVIETHLDPSLGPMATIIINTGTLKRMDNLVIGEICGRIKIMQDSNKKRLQKAFPSDAVQIAGLDQIPQAGDILQVTKDEKGAKIKATEIKLLKEQNKNKGDALIMQEIINRIQAGKLKSLKIVLKADTKGSLEAIHHSLAKINNQKVVPKIIHSAVGAINESDVMMTAASRGVLLGFNVIANTQVMKIAEKERVNVSLYKIIYNLIQDVEKLLLGLIEPEMVETITGHAKIKMIFFNKRKKYIIGCRVTDGIIKAKTKIRVIRNEEVIGTGSIINLKKVKELVKEIKSGSDCGIEFEINLKLEEGDVLEGYVVEEVMGTL